VIVALPSALLNVPGRVSSLAWEGEATKHDAIVSVLTRQEKDAGKNREKEVLKERIDDFM
jgi:hypothetical protein